MALILEEEEEEEEKGGKEEIASEKLGAEEQVWGENKRLILNKCLGVN